MLKMIRWALTTKMSKKWDFKNSPAMGHIKKAGKAIGDALGLTEEPTSRTGHFEHGSTEHQTTMVVRASDLPHAQDVVNTHLAKGVTPQPFKEGNVSSIMNGFEIRDRKTPPEGY